ncbi:MAG TPA: hypothetical protein PLU73_12165 [Bacteroidia bacterium]|nr:hypothetical protein [Bacteroidia bacterium]
MAAFTLNSETNKTGSTLKSLFLFLSDFKNFASILPNDKVEGFTYSEDQCSFTIKGITPMTVKLEEKIPFQSILFTSQGLGKFNFTLKAFFIGDQDAKGECRIEMGGDLNPVILGMAKNSLQQLINTMSQKLAALREEELQSKV